MDSQTADFIQAHLHEDEFALSLGPYNNSDIDLKFAAKQIGLRKKLINKIPSWCQCREVVFFSGTASEQSSSEASAIYKQRFVSAGAAIADLTGGSGVDTWFLSTNSASAIYVEKNQELCTCTASNFDALKRHYSNDKQHNISVINSDCESIIDNLPQLDLIYLDPSRRDAQGKRLYDPLDCQPPVFELQDRLLRHSAQVLVKLSPMEDISRTASLMPNLKEVHVVAVRNECKELLFLLQRGWDAPYKVICADTFRSYPPLEFFPSEETELPLPTPLTSESLYSAGWILEPGVHILKAGAFKLLSSRFPIRAIDANCHIYVTKEELTDFPGRQFKIMEVMPFSSKLIKTLGKKYPQASVTSRNSPLSVTQFRQSSGIREGSNVFIFLAGKWIIISTAAN